ncbi:MAG: hypothetical protein R3F39_13720 [Myxococcota bacterium]
MLCIDLQTADLAALTGGAVVLRADALGILLPGITTIVEPDAPVRVRVRPHLGTASPVRFAAQSGDPDLTVSLDDAEIAVEALVGNHFLRLVSFSADLNLRLGFDALPDAQLAIRVDGVDVSDLRVPQSEIFASARLDLVAPFVVDLVLGVVADRALRFDLDLGALLGSVLDLPVVPVIEEITGTGDWLRVLIALRDAAPATTALLAPHFQIIEATPGRLSATATAAPGSQVQLRPAGGAWSRWYATDQPISAVLPGLYRRGPTFVDARLRAPGGLPGAPLRVAVEVTAPEAPTATASSPLAATDPVEPSDSFDGGCLSGGSADPLGGLAILAATLALTLSRRRRRRHARLLVVAALAALAGCSGGDAPDLPCTGDNQCPARTICGPDATCIVATPCQTDAACCPGALCFNGYCRPTSDCDPTSAPCLTPGQTCEEGRCVATPCATDAACPASLRCIAGRCTAPLPCGGCAPGAACHPASGRCVAAPVCTTTCAAGSVLVVDPTSEISPYTCGGLDIRCACAPLADLPPPLPGMEGVLLATPDGPTLVSHDPVYGDLVASRFSPDLASRIDMAVDGVPDVVATSPPAGYRGGVASPGPRRGLHPAAIWRSESGHAVADLIHQDADALRARYARVDLTDGLLLGSHQLPIEGASGRYACIARHPATGRLTGFVYVDRDASATVSRLVRVQAQSDAPTGPSDWSVTLVHESPLPATADQPCAGACALTELCVRFAPGDDRCVGLLDGPTCAAPCAARETCVAAPTPACRPRVFPAGAPSALPTGQGLFVTCAAVADGLIAAWYDSDAGALRALRGLGQGAVPTRVDGTDDPHDASDLGLHARLAVSPQGVVRVAYQDARAGAIRVATQVSPDAAWEIEVVHAPGQQGAGGDLGAWPALVHAANGEPIVAYADTERGDIWVARRASDGCWRRTRPLADGGFAWPTLAISPADTLQLTSVLLSFDDAGRPRHLLVAAELPPPAGPCSSASTR